MTRKSKVIHEFQKKHPTCETYWRSIVVFGANTATYKFALAKSLLELIKQDKDCVTLAELAEPYSRHICEHLRNAPKQTTNNSSIFLATCTRFNAKEVSKEELLKVTERRGFNYVLDKFHNVNGGRVPLFYKYEKGDSCVKITKDARKLSDLPFFENLSHEVEGRWNLVERAWEFGLTTKALLPTVVSDIDYDGDDGNLFIKLADKRRRISLASARNALDGYQKGKCFYCFSDIDLTQTKGEGACEVDHFFPHRLFDTFPNGNWNGVWNLVLTCKSCNGDKSAKLPDIKYLERLHKRNEFLINSHHPLQDTLMRQTGNNENARKRYLDGANANASVLVCSWKTLLRGEEVF